MRDLSAAYPVWLCDVWGVVHDGISQFPEAVEALTKHRENGGTVILLTNAPRPRGEVTDQLTSFEVCANAYDLVITSGDVTRELVRRHEPGNLYYIGPARDTGLLRDLDIRLTGLAAAEAVVCTGLFDDETETPDDYTRTLKEMRERGLEMICANPDLMVRRGPNLIYCAGAIAERYSAMGGRVAMAGKPFPPMYELARQEAGRIIGTLPDKARMLAIGDGPETDMKGAAAFGIPAVLVAHGVSHGNPPDELAEAVRLRIPGVRIIRALANLAWD